MTPIETDDDAASDRGIAVSRGVMSRLVRQGGLIVASVLVVVAGCSQRGAAPDGAEPPTGAAVEDGVVWFARGEGAVEAFEPLREANLEGGECVLNPQSAEDVWSLAAYFPSRRELDTFVTVTLADGSLVRYGETRGAPPPATSLEELRARSAATPRTRIQLDFVTGEAMVMNQTGDEAPGHGVRGGVEEFTASSLLAGFDARVERVRELCEV